MRRTKKRGDEVEKLVAKAESPELGGLVARWFEWLESANGVSPRTRRRYAANTIYRYKESWAKLFVVLPNGRAARLSGLTKGVHIGVSQNQNRRRYRARTVKPRLDGTTGFSLRGAPMIRDWRSCDPKYAVSGSLRDGALALRRRNQGG